MSWKRKKTLNELRKKLTSWGKKNLEQIEKKKKPKKLWVEKKKNPWMIQEKKNKKKRKNIQ